MTIKHHPDDASLMCCSAGSMPEALALVMATHIGMCPTCRSELSTMEEIGVALVDALPGAKLDKAAPAPQPRAPKLDMTGETAVKRCRDLPEPLAGVINDDLDDIAWKQVAPGVWQYPIALSPGAKGSLRLLKVAPGVALPEHGHRGAELTLVLQGSYHDNVGTFGVGDVADLDEDVEHRPTADSKTGCICLVASETKARFTGMVARLVQPLTGL